MKCGQCYLTRVQPGTTGHNHPPNKNVHNDNILILVVAFVLQLGEVWTEIGEELELQNIRPITPDREALQAIERTVEDRSRHVKQVHSRVTGVWEGMVG